MGLIPGQGAKILRALWCSQKKKKKERKKKMTKTTDVHYLPLDMALGQFASAFKASVSASVKWG